MRRAVPLALLATLLLACKGGDKDKAPAPPPSASGSQVEITSSGITVHTDAGTFAVGGDAKVPDDFPKTVPIYPGAKPLLAGKTANGQGKPSWSVTLETPDEVTKIVAFYKSKLTSFTLASDLAVGDSNMSVWQSPTYDVSAMVAAVPGDQPSTSILLSVTAK